MQIHALAAPLLLLSLAACDGVAGGGGTAAAAESACVTLPEGQYVFTNGQFVSAGFGGEVEPVSVAASDPGAWRGRIETEVQQEGHDWLGIEVRGGVVLLTGTAPDVAARSGGVSAARSAIEADEIAGRSAAVIVDAVRVEGEAPPAGEAVEALPGEATLAQCQAAFERIMTGRRMEYTGSSEVAEGSYPLLDAASGLALLCDRYAIEIGSHTDARGAESYNERLSQNRANAIRDYLIANGVEDRRVEAVGYGEAQPIDTSQTTEAYARNRRTEFVLSEPGTASD